jgi:uncharacterized tellurite resistance protein B-like protein
MERAIAGYQLLMLLTVVDNKLNVKEDIVIREWLSTEFTFTPNLDDEIEILSNLKKEDFVVHFQQQMDKFYLHSTQQERNHLLQFALFLIKADGEITKEENIFFDMLFDAWNEGE